MGKQQKGLFVGNSHANGGIPSVVVETGQSIEIEGDEYFICDDAYNSSEVLEFKNKTNKEVLDSIYSEYSCKLVQERMNAGDFIICKVVVRDEKKYDRKGTIKEIVNQMQGEKSCRVENREKVLKKGGRICPIGTEIQTIILSKDRFKNDTQAKDWIKENNFSFTKTDEKENTYRFRQQEPTDFAENSFRTISISRGVKAVIGCPIKKMEDGGLVSGWFDGDLSFLNW